MASITFSGSISPFTENGAAVGLGDTSSFNGDGLQAGLSGDRLVVSISDGVLPSDQLTLGGNSVALDGRRILVAGVEVATFRGGVSSQPLTISLNGSATAATVETLLRSLRYSNLAENLPTTGMRQISAQLFDGAAVVGSAPVSLTVNGVADAPQLYSTQILYDSQTNTLPEDQASSPGGPWLAYQDLTTIPADIPFVGGQPLLGGIASISQAPGSALLTSDAAAYAGISNYDLVADLSNPLSPSASLERVNSNFPTLDRSEGYALSFIATVQDAPRISGADKDGDGVDDRAGFSAVLLSEDQKGIELGFWNNRIWAQNDGSSQIDPSLEPDTTSPIDPTRTFFTQGEFVEFDTTQTYNYELVVQGDAYTLLADSAPILTGPLRDYSAFLNRTVAVPGPFGDVSVEAPDPYEQSSFIFLGDNGPFASATVNLGSVAISTPEASPQIQVNNNQVISLPLLQVNDADGSEASRIVTLTPDIGRFNFASNSDVTVNSFVGSSGKSSTALTGSLSAINQLLLATTAENFQPSSPSEGAIAVDVAFDQAIPPQVGADKLDFNQDGFSDLLWYNQATGATAYWSIQEISENDGSTVVGFLNNVPLLTDWEIVGTADFNGDGQKDIFWRNYNTFENAAWVMNGDRREVSKFVTTNNKLLSPDWRLESTGNFDQDANLEFIWRHSQSGAMALWELNGADFVEAKFLDLTVLNLGANGVFGDLNWQVAATGDFNGDSIDDLVWRNALTGQNAVWTMNGTVLQSVNFLPSLVASDWDIVGAADYTQDGKIDLAWRNNISGANAIWEMDGFSMTSAAFIPQLSSTDWVVVGT